VGCREARGEVGRLDEGEELGGVRRGFGEALGEEVLGRGRGRRVVEGALELLRVGPAALGIEEDDLKVPVSSETGVSRRETGKTTIERERGRTCPR